MSFKLQNSELEAALLQISSYSRPTKENPQQSLIGGLLLEELPLSAKRRLNKIHKAIVPFYKEYVADIGSLKEECKEDEEKFNKEVELLAKEEVVIDAEKVSLSMIEAISTKNTYNFDIIEKFSE